MKKTRTPRNKKHEAPAVDAAPPQDDAPPQDEAPPSLDEAPLPWRAPIGPPEVPSVWRDSGYMLLVVGFRAGEVASLSSRDGGKHQHEPLPRFWARVRPYPNIVSPCRCILSFLARKSSGLLNVRARDIRRIVAMLTKEELEKLSERELAAHYKSLVNPKGPDRARAGKRSEYIEAILASAKEKASVPDENDTSSTNATPGSPATENDMTAKKTTKMKTKAPAKTKEAKTPKTKTPKEAKAPAAKKERKPREPRVLKLNPDNPFRPGSMKQKAYELFLRVKGDRAKTLEGTIKLGATEATARGWYTTFCKV